MNINWQQIVLNIRRHRALSRVAKEVGSDWQHINRLARGEVQQPKFLVGIKLLDLHSDLCPEQHRQLRKK